MSRFAFKAGDTVVVCDRQDNRMMFSVQDAGQLALDLKPYVKTKSYWWAYLLVTAQGVGVAYLIYKLLA